MSARPGIGQERLFDDPQPPTELLAGDENGIRKAVAQGQVALEAYLADQANRQTVELEPVAEQLVIDFTARPDYGSQHRNYTTDPIIRRSKSSAVNDARDRIINPHDEAYVERPTRVIPEEERKRALEHIAHIRQKENMPGYRKSPLYRTGKY